MGLNQLLSTLRDDAAAQRAEVLSNAETEASRIRAAATAEASRRRMDFISRVKAEAETAAHRTLARTKSEALETVLAARGRFLDRVREAVGRRIAEAAEHPEYLRSLRDELRASIDRLPTGAAVIRASPGLVSALETACAEVSENVAIEEAADIGTGFILRSDDGRVEVDATLETRLEYAWPRLAASVLAEAAT